MNELLCILFVLVITFALNVRKPVFRDEDAPKEAPPREEPPEAEKQPPEPSSPVSQMAKLLGKDFETERLECIGMMLSWMAEQVEEKVPESGTFGTIRIRMEDPEDKKVCLLAVSPSGLKDGSQCAIQTGCIEPGTDRLHSYFVFWGTKEETVRWLREKTTVRSCAKDFRQLRERCDAE